MQKSFDFELGLGPANSEIGSAGSLASRLHEKLTTFVYRK